MRIDLAPDEEGVGILIEGDADELEGFSDEVRAAILHGSAGGVFLDDEGVENVLIRRVDS